jgi:hypothetical protein
MQLKPVKPTKPYLREECSYSDEPTSDLIPIIPALFAFLLNLDFRDRSKKHYFESQDKDKYKLFEEKLSLSLEEFTLAMSSEFREFKEKKFGLENPEDIVKILYSDETFKDLDEEKKATYNQILRE